MAPKIEKLTESVGTGEGPHWDVASRSLYFLDVMGQYLLKYNPTSQKVTKASTAPKMPTFIIPVDGEKDQFLISLNNELVVVTWDGVGNKISINETLCVADDAPETANHKFNDAKCDSSGRLWTGTHNLNFEDMDKTLPVGTLYSFDSNRILKGHVGQLRLTNGFAFNEKAKKMFYIDSLKGSVDQFDFDIANGTITNRKAWFTFAKNNVPGIPDGMTIDTDGNLWVAAFDGGRVIKVDGYKSETLLNTIMMPVLKITSLTFGGPNLDELYVTSAHLGKRPAPGDGALYRITNTGSKGLPAYNFRLH